MAQNIALGHRPFDGIEEKDEIESGLISFQLYNMIINAKNLGLTLDMKDFSALDIERVSLLTSRIYEIKSKMTT